MPEEAKTRPALQELRAIRERLTAFERKLDQLAKLIQKVGKACGIAFGQVKKVVEHLTESVDETRQDLSEYGGIITKSTWDTDPF